MSKKKNIKKKIQPVVPAKKVIARKKQAPIKKVVKQSKKVKAVKKPIASRKVPAKKTVKKVVKKTPAKKSKVIPFKNKSKFKAIPLKKSKRSKGKKKKTKVVKVPKQKSKLRKGEGISNWNTTRSAIASYLRHKGLPFTLKELNAFTTGIYDVIKTQENIGMALENVDVFIENYFYKGEDKQILNSFEWWELANQLGVISPFDVINIDAEDVVEFSYSGSKSVFMERHWSALVKQINFKVPRNSENLAKFIHYQKDVKGVMFHYFLLAMDADGVLEMSTQDFEEWLKKNKINIDDIIKRTEHEFGEERPLPPSPTPPTPPETPKPIVSEFDKQIALEQERQKTKAIEKSLEQEKQKTLALEQEGQKTLLNLIKELKELGFTKEEIQQIIKK